MVLTDSEGVQQESCILKIPCVTLRENIEWVEIIDIGANTLSGLDPQKILKGVVKMLKKNKLWKNPFGDGKSAEKIISIIKKEFN